jgi:acetoin utilization protein AcuB
LFVSFGDEHIRSTLMKIAQIMKSPAISVELDDPLKLVKDIFDGSGFRHLLVCEHGQLVGVISERDLLRAISPHVNTHVYTTRDLATLNQRVHQIVKRQPLCLQAHASLGDAVRLFNANRIGCIPVVDEDRKPLGVVTRSDILRALDALGITAALDEVS